MTATVIFATALATRADDWRSTHLYYDKDRSDTLFKANEFSLDLFGTYLARERNIEAFPNTSIHHGQWGGGVGANYFWSRDVGIGADTSFQDGGRRFVDHVGGNLFVRLPIEAIRLAPFVFAGGGRSCNPGYNWFGDAGVGVDFRLNPKLAIFGDARYIWKDVAGQDQALLRTGIRLIF